MCGVAVGDAPGDGDGAALTVPVSARIRKTKEKPREFMTRNVQTYVHASTANTIHFYHSRTADYADETDVLNRRKRRL